ncbi:hypothetical protein [Gallaecimonas pentaromativorans]|uniref:hypothetical protein n=1 Tax=Gallaecimonas pentaromativorans TaxID=584787 RepID=UPI000F4AF02C|nr:hypothetical protein [Gallaecimonas pentaromativorans]
MKKWLLIFLFSLPACANYTCTGPVLGVAIEPKTGDILVEKLASLSWPRLCSVTSVKNGVSLESCKAVYSLLLSAQAQNKSVILWFNDGKDCTTTSHPTWNMLEGWYFGPELMNSQ